MQGKHLKSKGYLIKKSLQYINKKKTMCIKKSLKEAFMPKNTKVVLSILLILICSVAIAQTTKNATANTKIKDPNSIQNQKPSGAIPLASWLTEGFEGTTFPPAGWDTMNARGVKRWTRAPGLYHTGTACAKSPNEASGGNKDWLFTPRIGPIATGDSLTFWVMQRVNIVYESLYIRVSTNATQRDTSQYTSRLALVIINSAANTWTRRAYILNAYVGQQIYIAFYDCSGYPQDTTYLDDIDIKRGTVIPTVSITDSIGYEGNTGTKSFGFRVNLSTAGSDTVKINYTTVDSTATTADVDYTSSSGQLVFAPGVTSQRIGVTVNGDTKRELNEFFKVVLTTKTNATYTDSLGIGTILNDDSIPTIAISDSSGYEGNAGTKLFGFYIMLTNPSYQAITVHCATADSSATIADGDYANRADTTDRKSVV